MKNPVLRYMTNPGWLIVSAAIWPLFFLIGSEPLKTVITLIYMVAYVRFLFLYTANQILSSMKCTFSNFVNDFS